MRSLARPVRYAARCALGSALLFAAGAARAEVPHRVEGEHRVGIDGGISTLRIADKDSLSVGVGGGLHYNFALTDTFDVVAEVTSSVVAREELRLPNVPHTRPVGVDTLGAGVLYLVDLTRVSPYIGLLLSAASLGGGNLDHGLILPGFQLAGGVDVRLTQSLALGVAYREHVFLRYGSTYPLYMNLFLRAEYAWGGR